MTIITDLPVDQTLKELPVLFEQAIPQWESRFQTSTNSQSIAVTTYLMRDRDKFVELGMLTPELPNFRFDTSKRTVCL